MKVNILDAHDRKEYFIKDQANAIQQGLNDCIFKNTLSNQLREYSNYIYIYAHPRTDEDGVTKRMLWQPRLGKPKSQTNSYLFRIEFPETDIEKDLQVEICWMLPPRELWGQYKKGLVTENDIVVWSIHQFENNRTLLDSPYPDDFNDEQIKKIYLSIAANMDKSKQVNEAVSSLGLQIQNPNGSSSSPFFA